AGHPRRLPTYGSTRSGGAPSAGRRPRLIGGARRSTPHGQPGGDADRATPNPPAPISLSREWCIAWYSCPLLGGKQMSAEIRSYCHGALTGLRYVEHRAPTSRRFGQDADLHWASFRGHLQDVDRIDLLLRDADAQWPGSLGARRVFNLSG